jgi:hypothetical protein
VGSMIASRQSGVTQVKSQDESRLSVNIEGQTHPAGRATRQERPHGQLVAIFGAEFPFGEFICCGLVSFTTRDNYTNSASLCKI